MRGQRFALAGSVFVALLWPDALAAAEEALGFSTAVHITSIIMNGCVRIAAIVAGVYVVRLGHDTMVQGIEGKFAFEGSFGKLKGSTPGLLFVLLGTLAIGWALQATASGKLETDTSEIIHSESPAPAETSGRGASDKPPPFLSKPNGAAPE